jgi:plastocyanin
MLNYMFRRLPSAVAIVMLMSLVISSLPGTVSAAPVPSKFNSGDLIKGSERTVYYFASNGRRYVFPNQSTYFTWYKDFSGVKTISDGALSTIPLGENVTYRPGSRMLKLTSAKTVYVVDQGGVLRAIASEQLAKTLYGISWGSQINDLPDVFWSNYHVGTPIETAPEYTPANAMTQTATINQDKKLDNTKAVISIGTIENGFVPSNITIKLGTEITWTNTDIVQHTVVGKLWGSPGALDPGTSYTHKFNALGSFDYHCSMHPIMQGTVNVVR